MPDILSLPTQPERRPQLPRDFAIRRRHLVPWDPGRLSARDPRHLLHSCHDGSRRVRHRRRALDGRNVHEVAVLKASTAAGCTVAPPNERNCSPRRWRRTAAVMSPAVSSTTASISCSQPRSCDGWPATDSTPPWLGRIGWTAKHRGRSAEQRMQDRYAMCQPPQSDSPNAYISTVLQAKPADEGST